MDALNSAVKLIVSFFVCSLALQNNFALSKIFRSLFPSSRRTKRLIKIFTTGMKTALESVWMVSGEGAALVGYLM